MHGQDRRALAPSEVRAQVLAQHRGLREQLGQALDATTSALQGRGPALPTLSELAVDLRARLVGHLAFEELNLLPALAEADIWGPERVRELLAEHARQRAELDTLIEGVATGWDLKRLALTLRSLATDLLHDMAEEERACLSPDLLRDDVVSVDQATD